LKNARLAHQSQSSLPDRKIGHATIWQSSSDKAHEVTRASLNHLILDSVAAQFYTIFSVALGGGGGKAIKYMK
jgi:hypothetical protein